MAGFGDGKQKCCFFFNISFALQILLLQRLCWVVGAVNGSPGAERVIKYEDCKNAAFMPKGTLPVVALMSFPCSGNTWTRYLLERATGIYTGSVYNDRDLIEKGFLGSTRPAGDGSTLVVKTHALRANDHIIDYRSEILIVRNPYDAIVSFRDRNVVPVSHVEFADKNYFSGSEWHAFVVTSIRAWRGVILASTIPRRHVVFYDDLKENTKEELMKMLTFLDVKVNKTRFDCTMAYPDGAFKRGPRPYMPDPFSPELVDIIDCFISKVKKSLLEWNHVTTFPEYNRTVSSLLPETDCRYGDAGDMFLN